MSGLLVTALMDPVRNRSIRYNAPQARPRRWRAPTSTARVGVAVLIGDSRDGPLRARHSLRSSLAHARSQYILRPPIATERIISARDGLVRIVLKKPFSDGAVAVDMDPLSLLCRLAGTVPPPTAQ